MNQSTLIRPDWTPTTIALMVLGFVVFWPLGLAMLAYILWGDRMQEFKRSMKMGSDSMFSKCRARRSYGHSYDSTGNMAFDDWRKAELERLEEERRKLDETRAEFDAYMRELRRAKDSEEFDRFMNRRNNRGSGNDASGYTGN